MEGSLPPPPPPARTPPPFQSTSSSSCPSSPPAGPSFAPPPDIQGSLRGDEVVFKSLQKLGSGIYATCFSAHVGPNAYALKFVEKDEEFKKEVMILGVIAKSGLQCPHLIKYYGHFHHQSQPVIVLGPVAACSLLDLICAQAYNATDVLRWLYQICQALVALESVRVVHQDIAPRNILIKEGDAIVTDFNTAVQSHPIANEYDDVAKLYSRSLAPEAELPETKAYSSGDPRLMQDVVDARLVAFDTRADMWGFGSVGFMLLRRDPTQSDRSLILAEIAALESLPQQWLTIGDWKPHLLHDIPPTFITDVLYHCLQQGFPQRLTATEALARLRRVIHQHQNPVDHAFPPPRVFPAELSLTEVNQVLWPAKWDGRDVMYRAEVCIDRLRKVHGYLVMEWLDEVMEAARMSPTGLPPGYAPTSPTGRPLLPLLAEVFHWALLALKAAMCNKSGFQLRHLELVAALTTEQGQYSGGVAGKLPSWEAFQDAGLSREWELPLLLRYRANALMALGKDGAIPLLQTVAKYQEANRRSPLALLYTYLSLGRAYRPINIDTSLQYLHWAVWLAFEEAKKPKYSIIEGGATDELTAPVHMPPDGHEHLRPAVTALVQLLRLRMELGKSYRMAGRPQTTVALLSTSAFPEQVLERSAYYELKRIKTLARAHQDLKQDGEASKVLEGARVDLDIEAELLLHICKGDFKEAIKAQRRELSSLRETMPRRGAWRVSFAHRTLAELLQHDKRPVEALQAALDCIDSMVPYPDTHMTHDAPPVLELAQNLLSTLELRDAESQMKDVQRRATELIDGGGLLNKDIIIQAETILDQTLQGFRRENLTESVTAVDNTAYVGR